MCSYCKQSEETEVPDPYYGGPQGFEKVLDILKDACESLLDEIVERNFKDIPKGSCWECLIFSKGNDEGFLICELAFLLYLDRLHFNILCY